MLILPAEPSYARHAGSLEYGNLDGFPVDHAIAQMGLVAGECKQGVVVDRFNETIAQRIQNGAESPNVFGVRHMFLGVRANGAVVDNRPSRDGTAMDGNCWIHEVPDAVFMSGADFSYLAGAAADWVLMAL